MIINGIQIDETAVLVVDDKANPFRVSDLIEYVLDNPSEFRKDAVEEGVGMELGVSDTKMNQDKLAILVDMGLSMATYIMALSLSLPDIETFFKAVKPRLQLQRFDEATIDEMIEEMHRAVFEIKEGQKNDKARRLK